MTSPSNQMFLEEILTDFNVEFFVAHEDVGEWVMLKKFPLYEHWFLIK